MTARKPGPFLPNPTNDEPGVWTQNALASRIPGMVKGYTSDRVAPGNVFDHVFPADMTAAGITMAATSLSGAQGTIHLRPGIWTIDAATSIPANVRLIVEHGAILTKSGAGSLTINGPFEASLSQVFSGFSAGDVTFGSECTHKRHPEWWGARSDNAASNNTDALQCALSSSPDGGVTSLPPWRYSLDPAKLPLVPPKYTGNSGMIGVALIEGSGRTFADDVYGANNYGSTLFVASPSDSVPIFDITGTRGVTFSRVNFVTPPISPSSWATSTLYDIGERRVSNGVVWECRAGGTSGASAPSGSAGDMVSDGVCLWVGIASGMAQTSGSVAVSTSNAEQGSVFSECAFIGWDAAVKIGVPGSSANDDFWSFRDCVWQQCRVAINNYGISSYMVRARDCHFGSAIAYRTTGNPSGTVMNSFKALGCFFYTTTAAVVYAGPGGVAHSGADVISLEHCLMEGDSSCELLRVSPKDSNNACGFVARDCTFNTGDTNAVYNPSYRFLTYYGRGPFLIDSCRIGGAGRIPIELGTYASGRRNSASKISNNVFTSCRYALIASNENTGRPTLIEEGNVCLAECKTAPGDPYMASVEQGPEPVISGARIPIARAPLEGETFLEGCMYISDGGLRTSICRQRGTMRATELSGVFATLASGDAFATITAGTLAEIRRIRPGTMIGVGSAYYQEVSEVLKVGSNTIIYFKSAWSGATQTEASVTINNAVFITHWRNQHSAPSSGYNLLGDTAENDTPQELGTDGSKYIITGWVCSLSGSPGVWNETRALTGN